ncbi:unnamed protein product [Psylliodes chrysocephalus]|uniref:Angiogenic factor with G patch and FHA domains 1 n=1 Tax=Psylliodes chrysocephalus TaxID=3402493 RepID=A0A9P0G3G1_9CUCU|nr:unnamed protein product [Psylliodes chrysocephala]
MENSRIQKESKHSDSSFSETDLPFKLELDEQFKEKLKDIPEVLEYIQKLEKIIKKHLKKINKLRNKLKTKHKNEDVATQTNFIENSTEIVESATDTTDINTEKSLVDDIKEAAEIAMQKTGFVYEETSGLYYDYNTGYYYNAEYGLYYDGTTGQYLQYNTDTQAYEFHSQASAPSVTETADQSKRKKKQRHKTKVKPSSDMDELMLTFNKMKINTLRSTALDISKSWPPCMRVIVESTEIPDLKVGSLQIITCGGGSVGREGTHSILLKDPNVSKHHLKVDFDEKTSQYRAVDLGSRNGTLMNGKRMSSSKQESEATPIAHGSKIQIGQTVLLCHIHEGNQTCGHCEPGLIQVNRDAVRLKIDQNTRSDRHKKELNNLKMLYGVSGHHDDDPKLATGYTDRAQKRRETVGSQNPHEKTQVASVDQSINKENKGFKLLAKMGWKEGQSLGKSGDGLLEPIKPVSNEGNAGVGASNVIKMAAPSGKQIVWTKTKERFQKLPESNDAFDLDSDD